MPTNSVSAKHMAKEASDIPQTVGLVAMNGFIVFGEGGFEEVTPEAIDLRKSLTDQTVEFGVCSFLGATLDNHGWKLRLQPGRERYLHQFMATFFEIYT